MNFARHRISALRANLSEARRHWRLGRGYGYPPCCVAHFCWDAARGILAGQTRASQIGHPETDEWPYVYCGLFHAGESPLSLSMRLRGIVWFQWWLLEPTRRARIFRQHMAYGLFRERRQDLPTDRELARWRSHEAQQTVWFDDHERDPELEWR